MEATLHMCAGGFALTGASIDKIAQSTLSCSQGLPTKNLTPTDSRYHITILTKDEVRRLAPEQNQQISSVIPDSVHIFSAGLGGEPRIGVYWVVVIWNAGQQIRKRLGLPAKHFHITLTAKDVHDVDKGISSVLPGHFPSWPGVEFLDHLIITLYSLGQYDAALKYCPQLILSDSALAKGFLRIGDVWFLKAWYKLAMLAYACSYERTHEPKTEKYCLKRLVDCSKETEWGRSLSRARNAAAARLQRHRPASACALVSWFARCHQ